jgi:hypothetical protein
MTMKKSHLLMSTLAALSVGVFALTGCSGDDSTGDTTNPDGGTVDSGPTGDGGPTGDSGPSTPVPPTLGDQIDRFGRPAINTALNHVFDSNGVTKNAAKDAYNSDKGIATWPATYTGEFAANLAIFDSLNSNAGTGLGCGDQTGFTLTHTYTGLAGLLADDQLYVDTSQTTCTTYLGVELNAFISAADTQCGGRKLAYDVIATTYSAAVGTAFDDGVTAPSSPVSDTFPYLADPHP